MSSGCEYCGYDLDKGHNAVCVMNTVERLEAKIERLQMALDALNELHTYLDFEELNSDDKPWIFEDYSGINAAFEQAYAAVVANREPRDEQDTGNG